MKTRTWIFIIIGVIVLAVIMYFVFFKKKAVETPTNNPLVPPAPAPGPSGLQTPPSSQPIAPAVKDPILL